MPPLLSSPGSLVLTAAQKAAEDNGFKYPVGPPEAGWIGFRSTTVPARIWIGAEALTGPWFLAVDQVNVVAELTDLECVGGPHPGLAAFRFSNDDHLAETVNRVWRLSKSLPDTPLTVYRARIAAPPSSTEVERLVAQRVGQDVFRDALMAYWGGRCPLTGITDSALLRASHIVAWADCDDDAHRLDVHNGLLLSALWDAAFDRGLVSFSDTGTTLFSHTLSPTARAALGPSAQGIEGLRLEHCRNLARHRAKFGLGEL